MNDFSSLTRDELYEFDRSRVWHAFTQMSEYEPFIIDRGEGVFLYDIDGNEYIDAVSSVWCNVHGHCHPVINAAIHAQLQRVAHVTSLGMSNPTTIAFANSLVEISPAGLNHVFFSGDGSSAVEVALKMAFQYWHQRVDAKPKKTKYIALELAYHGDTLGSVSVGGVKRFHEMFRPLLFECIRLELPDTYRLPDGVSADDCCQHYLNQVEQVLQQHHDEIAALVVEPIVQGAAGLVMQPPGYLAGLRRLTRDYDVLLICDEVAVGFGRTGTMFACEQESVQPDLLCLAKGLTAGYLAMSATLATTEIWNAFLAPAHEAKTFFHGHTYAGNPVAAAAGLASLELFNSEATLENVNQRASQLSESLCKLARHEIVGDIRQRGLIAAVELVADRDSRRPLDPKLGAGPAICRLMLKHGVWMRPLRDVLVVMPPLCISSTQLDRIVDAIDLAITEYCESNQ